MVGVCLHLPHLGALTLELGRPHPVARGLDVADRRHLKEGGYVTGGKGGGGV